LSWKHTSLPAASPLTGTAQWQKQQLAGSITEPGQSNPALLVRKSNRDASLADAAEAPTKAAPPAGAAASATAAAAAAATTSTAATSTATPPTAAATPRLLLETALSVLLVEQVERRQAHVGDFLFTEAERLRRRKVLL
jgi:hypothetical protein